MSSTAKIAELRAAEAGLLCDLRLGGAYMASCSPARPSDLMLAVTAQLHARLLQVQADLAACGGFSMILLLRRNAVALAVRFFRAV